MKLWPEPSSTVVSARRVVSAGTWVPPDRHRAGSRQLRHFGTDPQRDAPVGQHRRGIGQADAILLVLDRDRAQPLADRDRDFAAGQERARLARQRGQVRVGERRHLADRLAEIDRRQDVEPEQLAGEAERGALRRVGQLREIIELAGVRIDEVADLGIERQADRSGRQAEAGRGVELRQRRGVDGADRTDRTALTTRRTGSPTSCRGACRLTPMFLMKLRLTSANLTCRLTCSGVAVRSLDSTLVWSPTNACTSRSASAASDGAPTTPVSSTRPFIGVATIRASGIASCSIEPIESKLLPIRTVDA